MPGLSFTFLRNFLRCIPNGLYALLIFFLMPLIYGRNTLALGWLLQEVEEETRCFAQWPTKGQSGSAIHQGHQWEDQQSMQAIGYTPQEIPQESEGKTRHDGRKWRCAGHWAYNKFSTNPIYRGHPPWHLNWLMMTLRVEMSKGE